MCIDMEGASWRVDVTRQGPQKTMKTLVKLPCILAEM